MREEVRKVLKQGILIERTLSCKALGCLPSAREQLWRRGAEDQREQTVLCYRAVGTNTWEMQAHKVRTRDRMHERFVEHKSRNRHLGSKHEDSPVQ